MGDASAGQLDPTLRQQLAAALGELIAKGGKKGIAKVGLVAQLAQLEAKVNSKLRIESAGSGGGSGACLPAATTALFRQLGDKCAKAYP